MATVEHRTAKTREWPAWAGTRDDIERISTLAAKLLESRQEAIIGRYKADLTEENLDDYERREIEHKIENCRTEIALVATAVHGTDAASGDPGEVLREVDRRTVDEYAISAQFPYLKDFRKDALEIRFTIRRNSHKDPGIFLKVESSDLGWANQAFSMLSDEIGKGSPRWSLHSKRGRLVTTLLTFAGLFTSTELIILPHANSNEGIVGSILLGFFLAYATIMPITLSDTLYNRIFPPIEMKGEDYQSTTGRRLLFFGSIALSVVVGIFVNRIS